LYFRILFYLTGFICLYFRIRFAALPPVAVKGLSSSATRRGELRNRLASAMAQSPPAVAARRNRI
jgi:hypothetical protein